MRQRLFALLPAAAAAYAASVLFPPYTHGWGCKPTLGSVGLVLVWLLPILAALRVLIARHIERAVLVGSFVLATAAFGLAVQSTFAEQITAEACR